MKIPVVYKYVIFGGLLSFAALEVLARLYLYYSRKKKEKEVIDDVFFFSEKSVACSVEHTSNSPCKNPRCAYSIIGTIVNCIERTTETLEVCIYIVTYFDLADAILKVHRKGKRVRVIADADTSECSQSQIKHLRRGGIPVRMKKSPFIMHHKFFIVDGKILVSGSFNWTMQAMTGNWDNVIITSDPNIVQPFKNHFDELWDEFSHLAGIVTV